MTERKSFVVVVIDMKKCFLFLCIFLAFRANSQEYKKDTCSFQSSTTSCCFEADRMYLKIKEKADSCFYAGNYTKALDLYERMLLFRADDWYPKMQSQRMKVYLEKGFEKK